MSKRIIGQKYLWNKVEWEKWAPRVSREHASEDPMREGIRRTAGSLRDWELILTSVLEIEGEKLVLDEAVL